MVSESELRERLAKIEVIMERIEKKMDADEKAREDCYDRFKRLEDKNVAVEAVAQNNDKSFSKFVGLVMVANVITLLGLKLIFHI